MKSLNLIIAQVQAFCQSRQYQGVLFLTVELETLLRLANAKQKRSDLKRKLNAISDPKDRNSCQITLLRAQWTARIKITVYSRRKLKEMKRSTLSSSSPKTYE